MARLSMNEMTTYRWSFEEDVQNYVASGIGAIGVWRQKLSDFGEEKGIELLSESGLAVSSLLWAGGFTGSEGRTYKESLQDAREAMGLAAAGAQIAVNYKTDADGAEQPAAGEICNDDPNDNGGLSTDLKWKWVMQGS